MGAFNQLNGAIFDAGAIEARLSAIDGKSIYNQRDGGILDMDSLARRLTALDGKIAVGQGGIEFDVDSFMRRLAAIEAGVFSPAQITFTSGVWLDPSDFASMFQDSAGTTPVTAATQPVGKILDKSGQGHHFTQSTTPSRPIETVTGPIFSNTFDGVDDGYTAATFAAGTLTSDMDCFAVFKRASSAGAVPIFGDGISNGISIWQTGNGSRPDAGAGTPTYLVDGGVITATRGALDTALTVGVWHLVEVRDADLSAWATIGMGNWSGGGLNLAGDCGGMILCPAQSTANRNKLRTWLGAKVGLSL